MIVKLLKKRQMTHHIEENSTTTPTNKLLPLSSKFCDNGLDSLNALTLNLLSFVSREHWRTIKGEGPLKDFSWFQGTVIYFLLLPPHGLFVVHVWGHPTVLCHTTCGTWSPSATSSSSSSIGTMWPCYHQFKHQRTKASAVNSVLTPSAHPPNSLDLPTT